MKGVPLLSRSIFKRLMACASFAVLVGCAVQPEPLTKDQLDLNAEDKLARVVAAQEPVSRPIDVYEAIARALKYNLDQRVELMQQALRQDEAVAASQEGLPALVAASGYSGRDNTLASFSRSVTTGRTSLESSTSTDRNYADSGLTLSWNVLDYGLSYVRARQSSDRALIQQEMRRKVLNRIVEDVRSAYWKAMASERLLARLRALESRVRTAMHNSKALTQERETSPVAALSYQRELIEIRRSADRIQSDISVAKAQLAALMNLAPGTQFRLVSMSATPQFPTRLQSRHLYKVALVNRPEVRENLYRTKINEKEATAALLDLLPGINLFVGPNNTSSSYIFHSNWMGWGAKASWNVMRLFQYPARKNVIESQDRLLDQQALALTMAVMTQVHVSQMRYNNAMRELGTATEAKSIQSRLLAQMHASAAIEKISEQTLIREEMNSLIADVKYDLAYADVQNAYANIFASLGLDAFPPVDIETTSVRQLSTVLKKTWVGTGKLVIAAPKEQIAGADLVASTGATAKVAGQAPQSPQAAAADSQPYIPETR